MLTSGCVGVEVVAVGDVVVGSGEVGATVGGAGGGDGATVTGVIGPAGDVAGGVTEAVSEMVGGGSAEVSEVNVSTTGALSVAADKVEDRWSSPLIWTVGSTLGRDFLL